MFEVKEKCFIDMIQVASKKTISKQSFILFCGRTGVNVF